MSNVHVVVKNDTLTKISKIYGIPVRELQNINHLPNPNKLAIGQHIILKKEEVLGFQALILDLDRNPISGLKYKLEFAGHVINGTTEDSGLSRKVMTISPNDKVRIFVERLDKSFKEVAAVVSGYGNKLVTLVSPSIKVEAKTEKHPEEKSGKTPDRYEKPVPIHDPKTKKKPTTAKKDLGPKVTPTKTPDGKPLTKVEGDIPDLSFLGDYTGGEITREDIEVAAKELKCEPGLIYAIARQESSHSSFVKIGSRTVPTILYERHWFRKLTKPNKKSPSPYEEKYYDICGPAYHKIKIIKVMSKDKNGKQITTYKKVDVETGLPPLPNDVYGTPGLPQYKRLTKAYQLDPSAALQSCSWGKFQIMGFNYSSAGYMDIFEFVKGMCSGDPAHIKAFLKFAKSNKILLDGLRNKDYEKIAEGHNGGSWKKINPEYAKNIEQYSKEYD